MTTQEQVTVWSFSQRLTRRLLWWSWLSMTLGAALQWAATPFWRAFGQQALGWGFIDGLIAWLGQRGAEQAAASPDPDAAAKQQRRLTFLLWLNAGLDVLYVIGGLRLAQSDTEQRRGHGWGIVVQGLFLFFFDLAHGLRIRHLPRG